MKPKHLFVAVLFAAGAMLVGCGRVKVDTAIQPDGTWTRTMVFRGPDDGGPGPGGPAGGAKITDVFTIPTGNGWKVTRKKEKEETIITAVRTFAAGETSSPGSLIKSDKGQPMVTDTVTVRAAGPNRWEYREVLGWKGPREKSPFGTPADELKGVLKTSLPPGLYTEADAAAIDKTVMKDIWVALFGPGDPLLGDILMHTDLAERKLAQRLGASLDKALSERFGTKMTADARREVIRQIVRKTVDMTQSGSKQAGPGGGEPGKSDMPGPGAMSPLIFSVKLPGKVVSTNGQTDPYTGEVYWALYAMAPILEDVTMTATCEVAR
jgi:hypothetical protein